MKTTFLANESGHGPQATAMRSVLPVVLAAAGAVVLISLFVAEKADAGAVINNGFIQMGVDNYGQLNVGGGSSSMGCGTSTVGVRFMQTTADGTACGCMCEGWGAS